MCLECVGSPCQVRSSTLLQIVTVLRLHYTVVPISEAGPGNPFYYCKYCSVTQSAVDTFTVRWSSVQALAETLWSEAEGGVQNEFKKT